MTNTPQNKELFTFNTLSFLSLIYKWRKHLLIIVGATIVLTYIFTLPFFIKPRYKAKTILFPASTNAISKALLSSNNNLATTLLEFGDEEKVEQMYQVLQSDNIRELVIKKFNLFEHYGISKSSAYPYTTLYAKYKDNIDIRRTEYLSIEIEVLDTDPQMAADIANGIAELYDSLQNSIQKVRAIEGKNILEEEYLKLKEEIKRNEDSLHLLRAKGVYDYEKQIEMLSEQLGAAYVKDNVKAAEKIQSMLDTLAKYGGAYIRLRDQNIYNRDKLSFLRSKYMEAKIDAEKYVPQKFIVSHAMKPEKHSYPVRWLIMLLTTFTVLLISIIVLIIIDGIKIQAIEIIKQNAANNTNSSTPSS